MNHSLQEIIHTTCMHAYQQGEAAATERAIKLLEEWGNGNIVDLDPQYMARYLIAKLKGEQE